MSGRKSESGDVQRLRELPRLRIASQVEGKLIALVDY